MHRHERASGNGRRTGRDSCLASWEAEVNCGFLQPFRHLFLAGLT
jgi:hypothetical protein